MKTKATKLYSIGLSIIAVRATILSRISLPARRPFSEKRNNPPLAVAGLPAKIPLPFGLGEFLDGVAEHCTRHDAISGLQPGFQGGFVALAGFAEEPADSLLDEVVGMMEKDVGDGESIGELAVTNEGHRTDDADALLPDGLAIAGQFIQQRAVLVEQPHAQQRIA